PQRADRPGAEAGGIESRTAGRHRRAFVSGSANLRCPVAHRDAAGAGGITHAPGARETGPLRAEHLRGNVVGGSHAGSHGAGSALHAVVDGADGVYTAARLRSLALSHWFHVLSGGSRRRLSYVLFDLQDARPGASALSSVCPAAEAALAAW